MIAAGGGVASAVRIERIAAGGDGVGRLADGRVVFIPRTAPGDLVEPEALQLRARFARARVGRVLEPGRDRVEPTCVHYREDDCGGCQLQHLSAQGQLAARRRIVGDALRRIGRLELDDPEIEPASAAWHYRTRITLGWSGPGGRMGFHPYHEPGRIFELSSCAIAVEQINRALPGLRAARGGFPAGLERVTLRSAGAGGRLHLLFRGPGPPSDAGARALLAHLGGEERVTLWWQAAPGDTRLLAGAADRSGAGSFAQVDPEAGERIRRWAIEWLDPLEDGHHWDLYAGVGEATEILAAAGGTVESVELDRAAVALADARGPGERITRHAGRVETLTRGLRAPRRVYCNPPREGMGPAVVEALLQAAPERIVYVSCDPGTLARDLAWLDRGYRLDTLRAFDLFPQTAHVETVAGLVRR